ncbi:MAG TPA: SIMPL domain-containing protein [Caulobacteraceae bacterium]|nr:SIMPL domain-containing protein [Caulobacteraceae bacterium]
MKPIPLVGALAALALAGPAVAADADARFAATTLDLSATGQVQVSPDMATISLGVSSTAATAAEAMAQTNAAVAKVVAAVRKAGIDEPQIQTSEINLAPQYVYTPNQPPKLTGYQASNQLTVTVFDLARVGPVADAVVAAGATDVGQISFGLRSRVAAENSARLAAIKALDDKAALYADAAGYQIKRLVNLTEGGGYTPGPPVPLMRVAMAAAAPPTPVETGELTVTISVSGEFELTH